MTFGSVFGRTFSPTFQPSSQAAASSASTWWDLNGTITSCVAAYQGKNASSYAASKVNLVNAATLRGVDLSSPASWDANGWLVKYNTGFKVEGLNIANPSTNASAVIRYRKDPTAYPIAGSASTVGGFGIYSMADDRNRVFWGNASAYNSFGITLGEVVTVGIRGGLASVNGGAEIALTNAGTTTIVDAFFGSSTANYILVESVAFYTSVLTAQQLIDLHTEMAAL